MSSEKKLINSIKTKWIKRKNDKDFWEQFQGISFEVSQGIYSDDNHFIYELIQNAEDTISIENQHTLEFTLENDGLIIFNNETGFNEKQIKAICSFKKSTKSLEKNEGFIGEKGIGFKSVFKITDKPAIFSNGYIFYFNRLDETGITTEYIIPHWIEDNELKKYPFQFQNNTHTTLYLPFSKEKKQEKINKLKEDIKNIEPILLLFLKKLTNIKISESGEKVINTIKTSTKDELLKLVTIQNRDISDKYYIFNKSINVDKNIDEVKDKDGRRKNVKKREIILAFPNFNNQTIEDRVFSFLPTKLHSELGFVIQADFILQSGRENIAKDSEWNQWQFDEIEKFINYEIVNKLKKHTKLKFKYLNYFLKNGNSHNRMIEILYENIISNLKNEASILADINTWQQPKNIILLEENISIHTKYLKLLFGNNYEQIHSKFKLDGYFIQKFEIKQVNKENLLNEIFFYLNKYNNLSNYDVSDVLYLTKIISKYLKFGRDGRKFDEDYFKKIKKSLPILAKYKTDKKFYLYDSVYISSEYKPDFIIESLVNESEFDFTKYNFLSDDYLDKNNKQLENFIKKIIDEQKENNNKKTIDFLTKYTKILQKYLQKDIKNHYKKVFDFLIEIQEDNKERISKIKLLLSQNSDFYNASNLIYFTNDSDSNLEVLDVNLFKLVHKNHNYKEFLSSIFKVKEADIINIILNEYLPWIKNNYQNRNNDNDMKLVKYTKEIIENFDKFEDEEKQSIKHRLYFISSNQQNKYLKSSNIYLSQHMSEMIFSANSIEKYITDKIYFDFLDSKYIDILNIISEEKIKNFFNYFSFEKNIKENDILNFIKFTNQRLELKFNIEVVELIAKSISSEKNILEIENFKIYSQTNELIEIKKIYFLQVEDFDMPYMNEKYIQIESINKLKRFFLNPFQDLNPYIKYLECIDSYKVAEKVYLFLYKHSNGIRDEQKFSDTKIRKYFNEKNIILDKDNNKRW